jgi:ubiquinone/menaquinone biosynthesis C-methylase UbiE
MSLDMSFSERYQKVCAANRAFYGQAGVAEDYVKTTLVAPKDQVLLHQELKRALGVLGNLGRPPVALDACGGAGNAALKLLAVGCETLLADFSSPMIRLFEGECRKQGFAPRTYCGEIGQFFAHNQELFDLIVFSSALHHIEDPVLVLQLAQKNLAPRGLIVTIFDPVRQPWWKNLILEPARLADRALSNPKLIVTRCLPVCKRWWRGSGKKDQGESLNVSDENLGNMCEFHGDLGFDDRDLVRRIESIAPLRALYHDRYNEGNGYFFRLATWLIRAKTRFKLLLQNTAVQ